MLPANRDLALSSDAPQSDTVSRAFPGFPITCRQAQQDWQEARSAGDNSVASLPLTELLVVCGAQQEGDQQTFTRTFEEGQFGPLGLFASLWCGPRLAEGVGMGCESIQLHRRGSGADVTADMVLRRGATAQTFNLRDSQFQVGTELSFRLSLQSEPGQPDRPVLVFSNIHGLTHPDDNGERRSVTGMEIHRTGSGLRYRLTLEGVNEQVELMFTNTTAYTGFLDMHNRIARMSQ